MAVLLGSLEKRDWIDYSSLSMLQKCPRSYYWRVVRSVSPGSSAALINGKAYHEARAVYREMRQEGTSHEEALASALKAMTEVMKDIPDDDPKRNLSVATDTLVHYFESWRNDAYYKTKMVEVGFAFPVPGQDFCVVGKIDEVAELPYGEVVMEFKTTTIAGERWHMRADVNLQIDIYLTAIYLLTGSLPYGGVLDVVHIHNDSRRRKSPFRIGPVPRSEQDVELCLHDVVEWWKTLQRYHEDNIWPRHTEACLPLIGYSCSFLQLCKEIPDPFTGTDFELPSGYTIEKWAPWEALIVEKETTNVD